MRLALVGIWVGGLLTGFGAGTLVARGVHANDLHACILREEPGPDDGVVEVYFYCYEST